MSIPSYGVYTENSATVNGFTPAKASPSSIKGRITSAAVTAFATLALSLISIAIFPEVIPLVLVGGIVITLACLIPAHQLQRGQAPATTRFVYPNRNWFPSFPSWRAPRAGYNHRVPIRREVREERNERRPRAFAHRAHERGSPVGMRAAPDLRRPAPRMEARENEEQRSAPPRGAIRAVMQNRPGH